MKTEKEKKEIADKFIAEILVVSKKYNAKYISICGELEGNFLGYVNVESEGVGSFLEASIRVGRLYQTCRERIKHLLDDYEK